MRTLYPFVALTSLALTWGCGSKPKPDESAGPSRGALTARIKAQTATQTGTQTSTGTQTYTLTSTALGTGTHTVTQTSTATATGSHSGTITVTSTAVASATDYYNITGTLTGTVTMTVYYFSWTGTSTNTITNTRTTTAVGPVQGTYVVTKTATNTVTNSRNGTQTKTATAAATGFATFTGTTTVTVTNTVTKTSGARVGTGTRTVTASGTAVQTGTALWTWAQTSSATQTGTLPDTRVVTNTGTGTATMPTTNTITSTDTRTITVTTTVTTTSTDTSTSDGGVSVDGGGSSPACLQDWRNTPCGQSCTGETQWDRAHCYLFLDCYYNNACGPATCGGQDDVCGVNKVAPASGMAPKTIADQVYACLGCTTVPPACATVELTASKSYEPPSTEDGSRNFAAPVAFSLPPVIPVTAGSAGNGTATLSFQVAGSCSTCWQQCTYQGLATTSHPTTPDQIVLGRLYGLQSCDSGVNPANALLVNALNLHINQGDDLAGATSIQLIASCATDNLAPITPASEIPGLIGETGDPNPVVTPETPRPTPPDEPSIPTPYFQPTSPEIDGGYVPIANPGLPMVSIPL